MALAILNQNSIPKKSGSLSNLSNSIYQLSLHSISEELVSPALGIPRVKECALHI